MLSENNRHFLDHAGERYVPHMPQHLYCCRWRAKHFWERAGGGGILFGLAVFVAPTSGEICIEIAGCVERKYPHNDRYMSFGYAIICTEYYSTPHDNPWTLHHVRLEQADSGEACFQVS